MAATLILEPAGRCCWDEPVRIAVRCVPPPDGTFDGHGREPLRTQNYLVSYELKADKDDHFKVDNDENEYQLSLRTVSLGAGAKDELPIVEAEAMNYEGSPIKVTLATLKMSVQPTVSLGGFEITLPVVLRLKCGSGPVHISGQPLVAVEEDAESEDEEEEDVKLLSISGKRFAPGGGSKFPQKNQEVPGGWACEGTEVTVPACPPLLQLQMLPPAGPVRQQGAVLLPDQEAAALLQCHRQLPEEGRLKPRRRPSGSCQHGGPCPSAHAWAVLMAAGLSFAFCFVSSQEPGPFPGIVDMFGTGGGLLEYRASLLAGKGFAVLALAYYNYEDLPKTMDILHLEYFEEAVNYLLSHPEVKGPGVGLLGVSKGGELCLSMASFLKGITAAVIINGSVANVGGTLHYKGETLPPVGVNRNRIKVTKDGYADIVDVLNSPLEGPDQKSFIPVERAESTFLFLVGQDDHNWKSEFYANEACKRLQAHGRRKPQIICYAGAGHYIEPPYFPLCRASLHALVGSAIIFGGEPRAHAMAQVDAWKQLQTFFHKHLGGQEGTIPAKV
ncbi:PREDICTED: acyl-coenzyme A thioesterase 1-like [Mandrillus leucophaeus]|nr:PREDICTED: acyl-coenzyme A thioesterase 1-like [Mandrillus leucophaeus]